MSIVDPLLSAGDRLEQRSPAQLPAMNAELLADRSERQPMRFETQERG